MVGRSGCGKSTLLRASARPRLRMMFQEARLLPWKSVLDNVAPAIAALDLGARATDWPADRVLLVEDGRITLNLRIDLARPRARIGCGGGARTTRAGAGAARACRGALKGGRAR